MKEEKIFGKKHSPTVEETWDFYITYYKKTFGLTEAGEMDRVKRIFYEGVSSGYRIATQATKYGYRDKIENELFDTKFVGQPQ